MRHASILLPLALTAAVTLAACAGEGARLVTKQVDPDSRVATEKDFDPQGNFSAPTRVDNRWHPLVPGTQFVFEGRANRGHGARPHRVIFTVTGLTKTIDGVAAVV